MKKVKWQFCKDPNDINKAIERNQCVKDINWEGLKSVDQIISITKHITDSIFIVFWSADEEDD